MNITVDIPGLESSIKEVRKKGERAIREVAMAVSTTAINVQRGAKDVCPVDTGRLRASIGLDIGREGLEAEVGTNVVYGPHVEFGTKHMAARPFLFPPAEAERTPHTKRVSRAVISALKG